MKKINDYQSKKNWQREKIAVQNYNRRIKKLNKLRKEKHVEEYKNIVQVWKEECLKISQRNYIRREKNNKINDAERQKVEEFNKNIILLNLDGRKICDKKVKILNLTDIEIVIEHPDIIVFSEKTFTEYADIIITNDDKFLIDHLQEVLSNDVIKLLLVNEKRVIFARQNDWGYVGLDGEYYGYLDTKGLPKFEDKQFTPITTKRFITKPITLENLPSKPLKPSFNPYMEKPIPIVPEDVFAAVEFDNQKYKLNFGSWKN